MITNILSYITRREGRKFLNLTEPIDDSDESSAVTSSILRAGQPAALYIHIPFCRTLCPFCCFNRYLYKEDKARQYFKSLKKELDLYIERGFKFTSFYFGGGTPPILMDELLGFIDHLNNKFEVGDISLETTPAEISPRTVDLLRQAGVKRLSIGVQSFDNDVLKAMGRVTSSGEEAKEKVRLAQGHFDTVNIDLIFNFPFQSLSQFEADVETFKSMGVDQATFYPLMASPHKRSTMERKFSRVNTNREKQFYDVILKRLYDAGYRTSTAWCFSRGDRMIDEYIINYDDYVGIGSGSVSIVNGNFFVNTFSLERYDDFARQGKLPIIGWRALTEKEALRYYLLTALFGLSIDSGKFRRRFGGDISEKLGLELQALRMFGLIEGRDQIKPTRRGMFPVSVMMRDFFASLNGLRERCIEDQI
jgi:coproporphyrinogen III oxidase-like Fe-S oxidoreductase